ncbi:MAG: SDR family oxidoreductase [Paracoccaceae bacterium]
MTQKTAIITGAARGIGLATTDLLRTDGWRVAMVDRDADALTTEAATRDNVLAIVADVSSPDDTARMVTQTLDWAGQIDGLVNNAGVARFGPMADTDFTIWREVMATNLDGVFLCTQISNQFSKEFEYNLPSNLLDIKSLTYSLLEFKKVETLSVLFC